MITLRILANGSIRVRRRDKKHNECLEELISYIVKNDPETMRKLRKFFKPAEDTNLLFGEKTLCG